MGTLGAVWACAMGDEAISELADRPWDVLIVGAGPAGSTAAIHLARRGHRVLLVDKARFPREKVCGDGLMVNALESLGELGLDQCIRQKAHVVDRISVFSPSLAEAEFPAKLLTLRRAELDALLAESAASAGATFCCAEVTELAAREPVQVSIVGCAKPVIARVAVLATGARTGLARRLGLVSQAAPTAVAVRCYVRSTFPLDRAVAIHPPWLVPGYAWIFPLGGDVFNVGCIAFGGGRRERRNLRRALDEFAASVPVARRLLQAGEIVAPLRGAMLRCGFAGTLRLVVGSVVGIGETIGSTLPFTGEGVGAAMTTGRLAAAAIHEAVVAGHVRELGAYPAAVEATLRPRHLAYRVAQGAVSVGWLNDFMTRRAQQGGWFRDLVVGVVEERGDSRSVSFARRGFTLLARLRPWPPRRCGT